MTNSPALESTLLLIILHLSSLLNGQMLAGTSPDASVSLQLPSPSLDCLNKRSSFLSKRIFHFFLLVQFCSNSLCSIIRHLAGASITHTACRRHTKISELPADKLADWSDWRRTLTCIGSHLDAKHGSGQRLSICTCISAISVRLWRPSGICLTVLSERQNTLMCCVVRVTHKHHQKVRKSGQKILACADVKNVNDRLWKCGDEESFYTFLLFQFG